jgi:hypothetical protein|tara:strand:- start:2247 stop:2543 length:297 start_codon:yes stop_codon:yes gene_type:complete
MTVKEYLIKIEEKLSQSLLGQMKEFIPMILENLEPMSLNKFIKEGDPVLELTEFKQIFDDTLSKGLSEKLNNSRTLSIIEGPFQVIVLENMAFRMGLN